MKAVSFFLCLFLSGNYTLAANGVLRIPVLVMINEGDYATHPISHVKELYPQNANLLSISDFYEVDDKTDFVSIYTSIGNELEAVSKQLGVTLSLEREPMPNSKEGTCYAGDIESILKIVSSLHDNYYYGSGKIWAWKFQDQKKYLEFFFPGQTEEDMNFFLSVNSQLWATWDTASTSLLLEMDPFKDGSTIESLIPRCK